MDKLYSDGHIQPIRIPFLKPLRWIGAALEELIGVPDEPRKAIGYALYLAQTGGKHPHAKPLKGFGGAHVIEIVEDHDGATFRAVYTVRFADAVYVLHVFQKKSRKGISTPRHVIDLVRARLKQAERIQAERPPTRGNP